MYKSWIIIGFVKFHGMKCIDRKLAFILTKNELKKFVSLQF